MIEVTNQTQTQAKEKPVIGQVYLVREYVKKYPGGIAHVRVYYATVGYIVTLEVEDDGNGELAYGAGNDESEALDQAIKAWDEIDVTDGRVNPFRDVVDGDYDKMIDYETNQVIEK